MNFLETPEVEYKILKDLFPPNYKGVIIDIGANEPVYQNNSYPFEMDGWKCYCVEPNPKWTQPLRNIRKNVYPIAIGDKNENNVDFFLYNFNSNQAAGSGLIKQFDLDNTLGLSQDVINKTYGGIIKVNVRTFKWFLESEFIDDHIDIIFIDVERAEMMVLSTLDVYKWKPNIIVIENLNEAVEENIFERNISNFRPDDEQHVWFKERGYERKYRIWYDDIYVRC